MALIIPGFKNDFADNMQIVEGFQSSAKELNIIESRVEENIQISDLNKSISYLIQNKYNLIIFSNYIYLNYSYSISNIYNNVSFIIVNNDPNSLIKNNIDNSNSNIIEIYYPTAYSSFLAGFASGVGTYYNKIAYLTNGEEDVSLLNMFYFGAKLANPNIKVLYYSVGKNATQEIVSSSLDFLIYKRVDCICGTGVYEKMILNYVEEKKYLNYILAQSNAYPNLNKDKIIFNMVKNWTVSLVPIISSIKNKVVNSNNSNSGTSPTITTSTFNFNYSFFVFEFSSIINFYPAIISNLDSFNNIFQHDFNAPYKEKYNILIDSNKQININNFKLGYQCDDFMKIDGECIQKLQFQNRNFQNLEFLGAYDGTAGKIKESRPIKIGFTVVCSFFMAMLVFIQICIYKLKNKPSFKSASPTFLVFITIGGMLGYFGIIIWNSGINNFSCHFKFWSISIGFSMMIGAIVVKNFRIWLIFDNPKLRQIKITNLQLLPWVLGMLLINIFLLCLISFHGGVSSSTRYVDPFNYKSVCQMSAKGMSALFVLLGYFCVILLVGVFVSWKIRIVDIEEFNESKTIAHTLYSISFCLLIIIPLLISQKSNVNVNLILCTAGVFLISAIILNMFIPKFYGLFIYGANGSNEIFRRNKPEMKDDGKKNNNNNNNKRVNLYLYDFTDDESESKSSAKEMEEFTNVFTQQPNSDVGNENTNYDDQTFTTEASEQPNPTPRTNITNTPRTDISTPRTDMLMTPRTFAMNTPRIELSTPRSENEMVMTPRQYHNHITSLSPIVEEENKNSNESDKEDNEKESQHIEINIDEVFNNNSKNNNSSNNEDK
ncbi:hypothetical protein DICPUDRAFT_159361 [Dictyostelium purpureum]|uniref:G-protein coupled receptors family 3 profile domain-containing protein n=1 Tax=Dictyostelium purpureum TaxID=5786 RepID=F1A3X6_DICPU|nr:uncharacterized protein DICPUDRAFT_159361 [Dictyostelium purpureum]EGC29103.1 hypothetical protein DICPUDRAFT_159361 [Dictyostelium purpureum]|eukprot:XP_003294369.1 hypothetical protein DICPUDRAFT_159361 [Dictyostelium purpureum]